MVWLRLVFGGAQNQKLFSTGVFLLELEDMNKRANSTTNKKWSLGLKTLPFVLAIVMLKFISHLLGYEFLSLNTLFGAIISANIFLIGFLVSGVLVDYKESEKIPGEMASSLEALADEGYIIYKNKKSEIAKDYLRKLSDFNRPLIQWFYKNEKTYDLKKELFKFNDFFLAFEGLTQANFIARLKQEQNILRRLITRVHTIRETSFLGTGYAIAEIITVVLVIGFVFIKIDPFYESVFFISFVSFILIYMIYFIKDLDNPFDYYGKGDNLVEEVSLKPLLDSQKKLSSLSDPASE
jgi:hypothetical protein